MAEAVGNFDKPLPENCRDKIAIILKSSDVDKLYVELRKKGIDFVTEPKDMPMWGMRVAHMRDPEDNLIEIWSELPQEIWDNSLLEESRKCNYCYG
jgi:predicted enzyme related to lactoylglutathione lyase